MFSLNIVIMTVTFELSSYSVRGLVLLQVWYHLHETSIYSQHDLLKMLHFAVDTDQTTLTCAPSITSMVGPGNASFTTMRSRVNPSTVMTSLALTNVPIIASSSRLRNEFSMIWRRTTIVCQPERHFHIRALCYVTIT